ncbi:outer membrane protein assembly factor BamD [Enterobacteriaceae endosymbiont of Donacia versicolorea]|uniref:outer membrane protein assembly factor BamD n=1 Tax=Enterobacteriaceae endosymbiont of Donacia versicolorea TaxID=2675788 RepID=UPI00144A1E8C|nr:outer membrane protein assembly factor BamD [Enterobacteriaceae endosymbiont of Donacia versicolorea]QJC32227.1 outer membrane protein assembly factor BamD [Enterobacteriaceae endosymbiont of Donacia versicolorea]
MSVLKKKNFFIINILILILFTTGCEYSSTNHKINSKFLVKIKYLESIKFLFNHKYKKALFKFQNFYIKYPYNMYTEKVLIYLIYLNYIDQNFLNVLDFTEEFINSYNKSPFLDYVLYVRIISKISLDQNNEIQNIFRIKRSNCNPFYANLAMKDANIFIKNYPNSIFIRYLKYQLFNIKKRLRKFDFNIIKFLFKKKMYIATINRCIRFLEYYSSNNIETKLVEKILKESFNQFLK